MTDLLFDRSPPAGPPWPLVFGDAGDAEGTGGQRAGLYGAARLPALREWGVSRALPPPPARMAGRADTASALTLAGASRYAGKVARPLVSRAASHWQIAAALPVANRARHQRSLPLERGQAARHQCAQPVPAPLALPWDETLRTIRPWAVALHQDALRLPTAPRAIDHQQADARARWQGALLHQEGVRLPTSPLTQRHQEGIRDRRYGASLHHQQAMPLPWSRCASAGAAITLVPGWLGRHQAAMRPPAGIYIRPPGAPPARPPCYLPDGLLVFTGEGYRPDGLLVFVCERADGGGSGGGGARPLLVIPLLKVYMTLHTLRAESLPGGETVTLTDVQIASDADNPGWSLSATGPDYLIEQLASASAAPRQIRITLDGLPWVFAVERVGLTRSPGQRRAQVSAISAPLLLGEPWLPRQSWVNEQDASAQQLVADALRYTGIGLDWQIPDWLVTAGAWSFTGTPLAAALRVAESVGAVVQSDPALPRLRYLPRYPLMPWEWSAPDARADVSMPAAAILTDSLERADAPAWEAVYVMGTSQGVMTRVKRGGTAGALLAPQVADDLMTHVDAARQRGRAILGAGGRQAGITLSMPLLAGSAIGQSGPGLLHVGDLLEVVEPAQTWRALVRGVSLAASLASGSVRQSLRVERHY